MEILINSLEHEVAGLCAAFDLIDEADGDRIGGGLPAVRPILVALESAILKSRSRNQTVVAWKARLLSRAIECDWSADEVSKVRNSLARSIASREPVA